MTNINYIVYIVLIALFAVSTLAAYHLLKINIAFYKRVVFNIILLIVSACILTATQIDETSLLIYILILILTLLGILMRIIAPIILNAVGRVISKLQGNRYEALSYDEFMHSGHRMYFCVLLFLTLKIVLYTILFASFAGII